MLEVRVTDAPDPLITVVYVTTDTIEVSTTSEGWISVIDEEIKFEILALEGVEAILCTAQLATGKYTQVRLSVPEVEVGKDDERIIVKVPSDTIKLVGTFEIVDDFKVDKSLVGRQRQGFLFKPVIKLASRDPGEIGAETVELTDKHEKRIQSPSTSTGESYSSGAANGCSGNSDPGSANVGTRTNSNADRYS